MSDDNKNFFEMSYRTGSDVWTHLPYQDEALRLWPQIPKDSLVLDVGAGRGVWVRKLVALGFRVIGIDYVQEIVDKVNEVLKQDRIHKQARFKLGDARDIPFTDESFDAATDVGLLQHLEEKDWHVYLDEVARVLKPGGYFLNVSLSRKTTNFLDWDPTTATDGNYEKFGLKYYFFNEQELKDIFTEKFRIVEQRLRYYDTRTDPHDGVALVFTLMKKR